MKEENNIIETSADGSGNAAGPSEDKALPENSGAPEESRENAGQEGGEEEPKPDIYAQLFDFFEMLTVALTIVILMFSFVGRHSPVNGTSMYPTLDEHDLMIVTSYGYTPKQGDIVVFQNPGLYERPFIKRVIAVEGQTIDFDFDTWSVYVDGVKIDEPYINYEMGKAMESSDFTFPLTLGKGYCWCMGDNRNNSTDSRVLGPIDNRFILGQAIFRLWPFDRAGKM